jgi:hypothetical protein
LEASVEEIRRSLAGIFEFDLDSEQRTASAHFRVPEPGITVTRDHISRALEQEQQGLLTQRELVEWATMILLNDAYEPDPKDEDFVAEWLNRISQGLDPT